jgi:hypothetical protein
MPINPICAPHPISTPGLLTVHIGGYSRADPAAVVADRNGHGEYAGQRA